VSTVDGSSRREPLVRPPRLHLGREGTASRLELFFDLAYVLVVLDLAKGFYQNMTWHGALVLTGLFVTMWFSWVGFTLYANRFDTDDVIFRVAKLVATASIAGCAASASDAVGKFAVPFAACYLGSRLVLLGLYLRAWRHVPEARSTIQVYLFTIGSSAALWAVSLPVPSPARYVLWAVAVLVSAAGPALATLRSEQAPLQIEHLPERFALLVILVLGEAVGGAARGVHDASWTLTPLVVGTLAFLVAAGMWWIYFDITAPSSTRELQAADQEEEDEDDKKSTESHSDSGADDGSVTDERLDLFVYAHLPLTLGIVLAGVGLEELVVHPELAAPSAASWVLAAGLAVFLVGVALVISGTTRTVRSIWPWPAAAIPLVLVGALVPFPSSLVLVGVYAAGMLVLAWQGTRASRRSDTALAGAD
jgi:low temperature requirement protein LtrA